MSLRVAFLLVVVALILTAWSAHVESVQQKMAILRDEARYAELPNIATPLTPIASSSVAVSVPILVYHVVRPSYSTDSAGVRGIAQTPEVFDAELAHLEKTGYHVIRFRDLEDHFSLGARLPPKPVILSFDDGWYDQFEYAFPILKKHHATATFFVFTNAIGRKGFLNWDNLRALLASGMTIGDHSRTHPYLMRLTDEATLIDEIQGSKELLEKTLGISVTEFAYPFGQHTPRIIELVKKAGYRSARGDYWSGTLQSPSDLYTLRALNAPTTTAAFQRYFP